MSDMPIINPKRLAESEGTARSTLRQDHLVLSE